MNIVLTISGGSSFKPKKLNDVNFKHCHDKFVNFNNLNFSKPKKNKLCL